MAGENRAASDRLALMQLLASDPHRFGFFQALRRLEAAHPERPRIGTSTRPAEDAIRLGQQPSMSFAPSTLASFKPRREGQAPRLEVFFFGLLGPNGPLPLHLTEYARDRLRNANDRTLARFLDMFHHRLLSLFYRAWSEGQPTSQLDRPDDDAFSARVASLIGIGSPHMRQRDALADYAKLHFAGHLSRQTRNAEGLLSMLEGFFRMPVRLEQYVGDWLAIPARSQWRLGESPSSGALGLTTILGERVWECQHKFRLTFGPLSLADYQRMLPGGASLRQLIALVRNYLGDEFDWDLRLILQRAEVRPAQLGAFGQLGWTMWMAHQLPDHDVGDLCLNPRDEGC